MSDRTLIHLRDHILVALRSEMERRPASKDLAWIDAERFAVARAANEWAQAHGGSLVQVGDIERVERMAVGHCDYAPKLALYAAELVLSERGES